MEENQKKRSDKVYLFFCGLSMGGADIVPGVSGGTIALIMGIYDRLILSISKLEFRLLLKIAVALFTIFKNDSRKNLKLLLNEIPFGFFIPLLSGILIAMLSVIHLIKYLLFTLQLPHLVFAFFFGLIIASIPIPFKKIKNQTTVLFFITILFTVLSFYISGLHSSSNGGDISYLFIFLSGMLAVSAMILPGISGSFILLLLGAYFPVIDSVHTLSTYTKSLIKGDAASTFPINEFMLLFFLFLGIIIGILSFIKVLKYLLLEHHDKTLAAISGLMIGGLRAVWPFREWPETFTELSMKTHITEQLPTFSGSLSIYLCIAAGFSLIFFMSIWAKANSPAYESEEK